MRFFCPSAVLFLQDINNSLDLKATLQYYKFHISVIKGVIQGNREQLIYKNQFSAWHDPDVVCKLTVFQTCFIY